MGEIFIWLVLSLMVTGVQQQIREHRVLVRYKIHIKDSIAQEMMLSKGTIDWKEHKVLTDSVYLRKLKNMGY